MNKVVVACAFCVSAALLAPACGSDDGTKANPNELPPGGQGGQGSAGAPIQGGTAPTASGSGGSAGSGLTPGGAGGAGGTKVTDVGGAGGEVPTGSAGDPAFGGGGLGGSGGETGASGSAGSGGDGPTGNVVFASFGTKLVWLEPETGKLHEVGDMRSPQGDVTYSEVLLAYGGVPGEAWIITPRYDATANRPPPELGKLDLCTGVVSGLGALTRVSAAPKAVEGLAMHPNGTWYVATGTSAQTLSNRLGTLNGATRSITDLAGTIDTLQDDIDSMVFVGNTLYGIDVATDSSRLELVTANLTTGAVAIVASPTFGGSTAVPLRLAYDETRSKAYSWRSSDRHLLEMSLTTGAVTAIGETHPVTVYPGETVQGLVSAPACP